MGRLLWKPRSESDGNLVILGDIPTNSLRLVDMSTGEVLSEGRRDVRAGVNNGYANGFRFNTSGANFNNVAVVDDNGRVVAQVGNGGARIEGQFNNVDNLYRNPVNTSTSPRPFTPESSTTNTSREFNTERPSFSNTLEKQAPALALGLAANTSFDPMTLGLAGALGEKTTQKIMDNPAGRAGLAFATLGGSELARKFGFGRPSRDYAQEAKDRVNALSEKGIQTHDFGDMSGYGVKNPNVPSIDESIKAGLKAEDVWGLPAFYERYGNDWLGKFTEDQRRSIAQQAVDSGAIIKKDNQTDVDFNKFTPNLDVPVGSVLSQSTPSATPIATPQESSVINRSKTVAEAPVSEDTGVTAREISGEELLALEASQGQDKLMKQNLALSMLGGGNNLTGQLLSEATADRQRKDPIAANLGTIFFNR